MALPGRSSGNACSGGARGLQPDDNEVRATGADQLFLTAARRTLANARRHLTRRRNDCRRGAGLARGTTVIGTAATDVATDGSAAVKSVACWAGSFSPQLLPGDTISVSGDGPVDTATVNDVGATSLEIFHAAVGSHLR
jgi:hypothetical protein